MKLPKITDDRQWANAGWPEIPWLKSLKLNTKKSAKTFATKTAKKLYSSPWLRNKLKEKIFLSQKVEKLSHDTYRLTTDFVFQSFLFVGKKRALLVDTGVGIGNLLDMVLEITDKPLTVVCTHAHFGVTGGAGQFDEVKIHKEDKLLAQAYNLLARKGVLLTGKAGKNVGNKPTFVALSKNELEHGFDLGSRTIKIHHAPSHTKGSVCFFDEDNKIAVVGDVVSPLGFQLLPVALPLNEYVSALETLIPMLENKKVYCSYLPKALDQDYARDEKATYYMSQVYGNDLKKPIKFRKSKVKKFLLLFYYGPKANRRDRKTRIDAVRRGDYKI